MLLVIGNNRDMVITSHQSLMRLVTWPVTVTRGPLQILIPVWFPMRLGALDPFSHKSPECDWELT